MSLSIHSLPVELVQIIVGQIPDWKGRAEFAGACKFFNDAVGKYTQEHQIEYNEAKEKGLATRNLINRIGEIHNQWEQAQAQLERGQAKVHELKIDHCWVMPFSRILSAILPNGCWAKTKKAQDKVDAARLKIEFLRNELDLLIATRGVNWSEVLNSHEIDGLLTDFESFETVV